jgi:hypothetical protein
MGTPEFDQSRDERKKVELCTPEDPSPFRANASARPLGCTGRVPPRGHRPKPTDTRKSSLASAARHTGRIVCVRDSPERRSLSQRCRRSPQKGKAIKGGPSSNRSLFQQHRPTREMGGSRLSRCRIVRSSLRRGILPFVAWTDAPREGSHGNPHPPASNRCRTRQRCCLAALGTRATVGDAGGWISTAVRPAGMRHRWRHSDKV